MQYLGEYRIDDYITFGVQLHRFSSGAVYAPTGNVNYTFYENNSTTGAPASGTLSQLNSKTGLYTTRLQLTTASSFEAGKEYLIHVEATVDGVAAAAVFMFRIVDKIFEEVVEGSLTFRQALRLLLSVLTGKSSGGGTATLVFRDIGDSKDRLSVTVDANGNRTAVGTRDGT